MLFRSVVVSASEDLETAVRTGYFSEELFHYIAVIKMEVPSLNERIEDLPLLIDHFIDKYNKFYGKSIEGMSEECLNVFLEYNWPGNVDQLESLIFHFVQIKNKKIIELMDLPVDFYKFIDKKL